MYRFDLAMGELDIAGEVLAMDVRQFPFAFGYVGITEVERLRAAAAFNDMLYERGYAADSRFVPEFEHALGVYCLGRPAVSVLGNSPHGPVIARAAADEEISVLAVQAKQRVHFTVGGWDELVPSVVTLLPDHPKRRGKPIKVAAAKNRDDEHLADITFMDGPGQRGGSRARDMAAVREVISTDPLGQGSMRVSVPGRSLTLDWFDTRAGRTVAYSVLYASGAESVVYAPCDRRFLDRILRDYLRKLGGRA